MSTAKREKQRTLKNPVFLEYAENEISPHWYDFFKKCAFGEFQKGVSYRDGILAIKKGNKRPVNLSIPNDVVEAMISIKRFVISELGEISIDELTKKRAELDVALIDNILPSRMQWKEIRAPTVKQHLISMFVAKLKEDLSLSVEQADNLHSILSGGFASGVIGPEDVVLDNHKIVSIDKIDIDDNGVFHLIGVTKTAPKIVRKPPPKKNPQTTGTQNWDKKIGEYSTFLSISVQ